MAGIGANAAVDLAGRPRLSAGEIRFTCKGLEQKGENSGRHLRLV